MDDYVMAKEISRSSSDEPEGDASRRVARIALMRLRFTKMQGVGNDFVVLDAIGQNVALDAASVRRIADRHFGVGCDQMLLIERPRSPGTDFYYRIFNADGEEVQHCGNGARCFLRYVRDKGLTEKREIRVETLSGVITPRLEADGQVTVDMGPPKFAPAKIPFIAEREQLTYHARSRRQDRSRSARCPWAIRTRCKWSPMWTRAPVRHAGAADRAPCALSAARQRRLHADRRSRIASGCASTSAARAKRWPAAPAPAPRWWRASRAACWTSPVTVQTRGGDLTIAWDGAPQPVLMTGPAQTVFEGELEL